MLGDEGDLVPFLSSGQQETYKIWCDYAWLPAGPQPGGAPRRPLRVRPGKGTARPGVVRGRLTGAERAWVPAGTGARVPETRLRPLGVPAGHPFAPPPGEPPRRLGGRPRARSRGAVAPVISDSPALTMSAARESAPLPNAAACWRMRSS